MYATLGVLGGMGPAASAAFLHELALGTPAERDQDHVPVIMYADPRVPDRTAAILGQGPSPLPQLQRGVRFLEGADVACIAVPCNTAHVWLPELRADSRVPILSIVESATTRVQHLLSVGEQVGILSTDGTRTSGLYPPALAEAGLGTVEPTAAEMEQLVAPAIAAIKGGALPHGNELLQTAGRLLVERGAAAILIACTDISVVLGEDAVLEDRPVIDSTRSLALAAIDATHRLQPWCTSAHGNRD